MKLYKYMDRKWAREFLVNGIIRIGTLYEFRNVELHGAEIGDASEGRKDVYSNKLNYIDTADPEGIPYWMKQRIGMSSPGENCRLQIHARDGMSGRYFEPDSYLYCMTDIYDEFAMLSMGYNCCIEVFDVESFCRALSNKLSHKAEFWGSAKCHYKDRKVDERDDDIPASFIKEEEYAHQREVRTLWIPNESKEISPVILKAKKAARYCRMVNPNKKYKNDEECAQFK